MSQRSKKITKYRLIIPDMFRKSQIIRYENLKIKNNQRKNKHDFPEFRNSWKMSRLIFI